MSSMCTVHKVPESKYDQDRTVLFNITNAQGNLNQTGCGKLSIETTVFSACNKW